MKDTFNRFLVAYGITALLTFGYATNAEWVETMTGWGGAQVKADGAFNVMNGMAFGLAWPLYLSYKAFRWARP